MAQTTEHFKAPEKIQLSEEEIANLSDAQFKTLVESVRKPDEKMKPMLTETKENVQGTNSDAKETWTQINSVDQRKKETSNQKRMKKQELGKMRRGLGTSRTSRNVPTSEL